MKLYRNIFPYTIYTIPDKKLAYIQIPKTGCTTIKTQIFFPYLHPEAQLTNIHEQLKQTSYLLPALLPLQLKGYFIFTVVRDPIERFISLYNVSKFAYPNLSDQDKKIESIRFFGEYLPEHHNIDKLIDKLSPQHVLNDPHVTPQSMLVPGNLSIFDHIGTTSRMDETFAIIEQYLDHPLILKQLYSSKRSYRDRIMPEKEASYEKLRLLYQRDYELLGEYF